MGAGAVFFVAAAFLTGAPFAAFAGAVWTAAFFTVVFFRAGATFLAAAFAFAALAALAFLRFATSFAFAAAESFRFGFGAASGADGSAAFLEAAHRLRWASAIAFLPAALIFRRLRFAGSGVAAV